MEEGLKHEGLSLFAGNGYESDVVKAYLVRSIPIYVLIDKEGKIINADAIRPSAEAIRGILDDLLSKI